MKLTMPLPFVLAIGIMLGLIVREGHAEIIYSGKQNLVLRPGEVARLIPWAGPALTFDYEISSIICTQRTKLWGRLYITTTRDTGVVLLRDDSLASVACGDLLLPSPCAPPYYWAGVYKLPVASWSGDLTTGEWSGWQGTFAASADAYLGGATVSKVGWLHVQFGQLFNNGSPEFRLVDGAYQTDPTHGIIVGSTNEPFRLRITRLGPETNEVKLDWLGGSGLYLVQRCTNLAVGPWENFFGPTNATQVTLLPTNPAMFFRVQRLTEP